MNGKRLNTNKKTYYLDTAMCQTKVQNHIANLVIKSFTLEATIRLSRNQLLLWICNPNPLEIQHECINVYCNRWHGQDFSFCCCHFTLRNDIIISGIRQPNIQNKMDKTFGRELDLKITYKPLQRNPKIKNVNVWLWFKHLGIETNIGQFPENTT